MESRHPGPPGKIDPQLQRELARMPGNGTDTTIPVLIETPAAPPGRARLERILTRLREMGAQRIQVLELANAVATELRPSEVPIIASLPEVQLIRLERWEHLTT